MNYTYGEPTKPLWTITAKRKDSALLCTTSMYRGDSSKIIRKLFAANPIENNYEIIEIEQIGP